MGIQQFPEQFTDPKPLVIASKNWSPGTAGFVLDELQSEFQYILVRSILKFGTTGNKAALGALPVAGVNPQGTQFLMQSATFVYGGASPAWVTFPQGFPNDCWVVVACFGDSPGLSLAHVGTYNYSGFYFYSSASVGHRINYFAIGY